MRATLARMAGHFSFTPTDGVLVVSGQVAPDGRFNGTLVTDPGRRDQPGRAGSGTPPFILTVTGQFADDAATGTYATPRCHTAFHLPRIGATLAP